MASGVPVRASCCYTSFIHSFNPLAWWACCIFGTIITSHKMFASPPSATADVVGSSDRPCATGMKETSVKRTHTVRVSAQIVRSLSSSSVRKS